MKHKILILTTVLFFNFSSAYEFNQLNNDAVNQKEFKNFSDIESKSKKFYFSYGLSVLKSYHEDHNNNVPTFFALGYYITEKLSLQGNLNYGITDNTTMTKNVGIDINWHFLSNNYQKKQITIIDHIRPKISAGILYPIDATSKEKSIIYKIGAGFDFDISRFLGVII